MQIYQLPAPRHMSPVEMSVCLCSAPRCCAYISVYILCRCSEPKPVATEPLGDDTHQPTHISPFSLLDSLPTPTPSINRSPPLLSVPSFAQHAEAKRGLPSFTDILQSSRFNKVRSKSGLPRECFWREIHEFCMARQNETLRDINNVSNNPAAGAGETKAGMAAGGGGWPNDGLGRGLGPSSSQCACGRRWWPSTKPVSSARAAPFFHSTEQVLQKATPTPPTIISTPPRRARVRGPEVACRPGRNARRTPYRPSPSPPYRLTSRPLQGAGPERVPAPGPSVAGPSPRLSMAAAVPRAAAWPP